MTLIDTSVLCELAAEKFGAGDVALLVERDQLIAGTAIDRVDVWTLDADLRVKAAAAP